MPVNASTVPAITALLQNRAQLKSRATQIAGAPTLTAMLQLLNGTAVEQQVFTLAQQSVAAFFADSIAQVEGQLTNMGIALDV